MRALAALRRAARIDHSPPELHEELGLLCLELGVAADAREPILTAGRGYQDRRDFAAARGVYERALRAVPTEIAYAEALVLLAEAVGDVPERARARARAALCRASIGDLRGSMSDVASAIVSDPGGENSLAAIEDGIPALAELWQGAIPDKLPGLGQPNEVAAWAVLRARMVQATRGDVQEVTREIASAARRGTISGLSALWAGAFLLRAGDDESADRALRIAVRDLGARDRFLQPLADALAALVGRDPSRQWAVECLERLTDTGRRLGGSKSSRESTGEQAVSAEGAPPLPDEIRARIFEAEALVQHGLVDTAARVLQAVPVAHRAHPLVARVMQAAGLGDAIAKVESRPTLTRRPVSPADPPPEIAATATPEATATVPPVVSMSAPAPLSPTESTPSAVGSWTRPNAVPAGVAKKPAAAPRKPPPPADDGLDIVLEEMTGEVTGEVPAPVAASPPQRAERSDLSQIGERIGLLVPDSDPETSYQMAIGLVEMGLADQARPLLKHAMTDPTRLADAALLLVRVEVEAGDDSAALAVGAEGFKAAAGQSPALRAELAAAIAPIAQRLGRKDVAKRLADEVRRLAPAHRSLPELERLR